ncbi:MAG: flagellar hook-associated protein FlgK [Candidatus Velthaea sp.]
MSFFGLNIAGNALSTAPQAANVTSDNISNVNTPGASRQHADITEAPPISGSPFYAAHAGLPGTRGEGTLLDSISRIHQDSYDGLFRGASSSENFFTVQQQQLSGLQSAFGEPSNGINAAFTGLQTAANNLASQPTSIPVRASVITAAQSFVNTLNTAGTAIQQQQQSVSQQAAAVVTKANGFIDKIAALNGQIRAARAVGDNPNTYLDQRDYAIDQLSQLISTQTAIQANGSTLVTVNGQALVNDTIAYHLASPVIGTNPNGTPAFKIGFTNDLNPSNPQAVPLGSGQLAAYADLYNNKLAPYAASLDAFANAAAAEIDRVTQAGVDLNGNGGLRLLQPIAQQQSIGAGNIKVGITDPSQIPAGLITTAAGGAVAALNSANNTIDTAANIVGNVTLNNPPAAPITGVLLVAVDGITPVAPSAGPPPVAGVQAFAYDTTPGTGNAATVDSFIQNFNSAQLGVSATFDKIGQKIVFSRDPNNIGLVHRAAQGNSATTPGFTIEDRSGTLATGYPTAHPAGAAEPIQGTPSTYLLQSLGASALNLTPQTVLNAYGNSGNAGANALVKLFAQSLGIGSLQSTAAAASSGFPTTAGASVTISPPPAPPGFAGAFSTLQAGQLLTVDAGTPAQENVIVTAVNRTTGTFTATFANAHAANFSITTAQTQTLGSAYGALVGRMGLDLQTAATGNASQTALAANINKVRAGIDGINIDEETQNLIKYQSAYAAAAKTVNVLDQMLQTVIGLVR